MTSRTYRNAVEWIALNDNPGDNQPADIVASYLTVTLVADLFNKLPLDVAKAVIARRAQWMESNP